MSIDSPYLLAERGRSTRLNPRNSLQPLECRPSRPLDTSLSRPTPVDLRDAYAGRTVLVLGASGFIGRWVAHALAVAGASLHLLVRDRSRSEDVFSSHSIEGRVWERDLAEGGALAAVLVEVRPATIFNLAGYGVDPLERDEVLAYRMNETLVRDLCAAAARLDQPRPRIVHAGSALEYGAIGGDLVETSHPSPQTLYGKSKLAGSRALMEAAVSLGMDCLTARLFMVYGAGERPRSRLLPSLIEMSRTASPLSLSTGGQQRDFTYVGDAAEGLLRLGAAPATPGEIVNVATGRLTSVREFAETAARILEISADRLRFGAIEARPGEMCHDAVNVARLEALTGWRPTTAVAHGIHQTISLHRR